MKTAILSTLVYLFLISGASATSIDDWNGFYVGGGLSFSTAETNISGNRFTYNQNRALNLVNHGFEGAGVRGFAGWNTRRGSLLYGTEVELNWDSLESNLVFNSDNDIDQVEINWSGALVGRLGFVKNETLFYTKAGLAFAKIKNVGGDVNGGTLTMSDAHIRSDVFFGPIFALGLERFVADNWLARVEYSHTDFGGYSQANQDGAPGSQVYRIDNGPIQKLTFGFAFKF